MKVWLDAQLPPGLCAWLESEYGIEAIAVRSLGLRDAPDAEIFREARAAGAIILSKDADFCELVQRHGAPPQIVWVTCGNTSNIALRRFLTLTFKDALTLLEAGEPLVQLAESRQDTIGPFPPTA